MWRLGYTLVLTFVGAMACSEAPTGAQAQDHVPATEAAKKSAAQTSPQESASFSYSAQGLRDPFRSYLVEISEQRSGEHQTRKREQTEMFELTDYHLTGLMTGISQPRAMLEDPQGHGHVVQIGTRLGKNGGRVTTIAPHGIQVVEDTVDPLGRHVRNAIDVLLPQSPIDAEPAP